MTEEPYPHARDDCDSCAEFDADMAAHYDGLSGRDPRWCHRCAGQLLSRLVVTGQTVSVYPLDGPVPTSITDDAPVVWTVDLAEEVLRLALPSGSVFLRALVDEGGTATVERLKELTGSDALGPMTVTLNSALKKATGRRLGKHRHLARPRRNPANPRREGTYDYALPADAVAIFEEALRRLDL